MLAGEELYEALSKTHRLFEGQVDRTPIVFETFPHAIECSLSGKVVSAKKKRKVRPSLLISSGVECDRLTNIDLIDAALCALTAHRVADDRWRGYGDKETGLIVVPQLD
jgi:predicted RNase H-like nuclease